MKQFETTTSPIPSQWVGPIKISGDILNEEVSVPLTTYETPLWPSVGRGAKISRLCGGIKTTLIDERMSRSILLEAPDAGVAISCVNHIKAQLPKLNQVVAKQSRFAKLIDINSQIVGKMIYLRLEFTTGDASGHNMVTQGADNIIAWILQNYSKLRYVSISGNYCSDKKPTAVNGILGRGKNMVTEIVIPQKILKENLKTSAAKIVELNIKKNLIGTMLAGGLRSANAHYANMLLAFYLATGQDAANIIEGSQGIVHAEEQGMDLYFSCNIPNLIVGSVGNGKGLDFIEQNLARLGCKDEREPGANGRRLAAICAATVLCGELSLLAAQTNVGELMQTHIKMER